ncbi:universal stress protein [Zhengella sp. ZM62]|uniref:universal stress protein n=1 Tax=Zhengella sedimenti TaxID=3390035 RepID=UPI00397582D4
MKKILVATDFSERSDRALRRATLLARQFGAEILLVHVVDDDQPRRIVEAERAEASTLLTQMAATLRDVDGVPCEALVPVASPFLGIVQAALDTSPDLLVIGSHRRQVLRDVFIGTTAERIIRSVERPVLMVNAPPASLYKHILATTDLSDRSKHALEHFYDLGIHDNSLNSIIYIFDVPALRLSFSHSISKDDKNNYMEDEKRGATAALATFVASLNRGTVRQILRHEATTTQNEILNAAAEQQADLIVISTHGQGGLAKLLLGSVTEQVLRSSPIDVLTIPAQRER